jgi:hypothetical protein
MTERLYDPDQANHALPLVRAIVADVRRTRAEHKEALARYEALNATPLPQQQELNRLHRALIHCEEEREQCLRELSDLSVVLEHAEEGVCDFPAELEGRSVMLCWHPGDESLEFFHGRDETYAVRRPLPVAVSSLSR